MSFMMSVCLQLQVFHPSISQHAGITFHPPPISWSEVHGHVCLYLKCLEAASSFCYFLTKHWLYSPEADICKESQMAKNSWREIKQALYMEGLVCQKLWSFNRDRFYLAERWILKGFSFSLFCSVDSSGKKPPYSDLYQIESGSQELGTMCAKKGISINYVTSHVLSSWGKAALTLWRPRPLELQLHESCSAHHHWTQIRDDPPSYEGTVVKDVAHLRKSSGRRWRCLRLS